MYVFTDLRTYLTMNSMCAAWLCLAEVSLVAGAKKGDKNTGKKDQAGKKDQTGKKDQAGKKDQGGKKADNKGGNKAGDNDKAKKDDKVKPRPDTVRYGFSRRFFVYSRAHALGYVLKVAEMRLPPTAGFYGGILQRRDWGSRHAATATAPKD